MNAKKKQLFIGMLLTVAGCMTAVAQDNESVPGNENPAGKGKYIISDPLAPKAIGPYSQAVEINGMLFISGQVLVEALKEMSA